MKQKALRRKVTVAKLAKMSIPEVNTVDISEESMWQGYTRLKRKVKIVTFRGDDFKLRVECEPGSKYWCGHTKFQTMYGEKTFDRRGVQDSFYIQMHHTTLDVEAILEGQVRQLRGSQARILEKEPVPGIGYLIASSDKATIRSTLIQGGTRLFSPSGFGTGKILYHGSKRNSWDTRAPAETEAYFDLDPLYIILTDHD